MPTPTHPFPAIVLKFLRSVLASDPSLGHALITSLSVHQLPRSQRYLMNNETLQLLYLDIASECIEKLRDVRARRNSNREVGTHDSQGEHGRRTAIEAMPLTLENGEKLREQIYQMLSLVNPYPEMNRAMKQIEGIFEQLLFLLSSGVEPGFSLGAIYSCLIGRPSCLLARKLQEVEKMLKSQGTTASDSLQEEGGILEGGYWKSVFHALHHKREHFLELVMVS